MRLIRDMLRYRRLALLVWATALLLRLVVPTGYMFGGGTGGMTVTLCSGSAKSMMSAMHRGMARHGDATKEHGSGASCAFSALSSPTLGPEPPVPISVVAHLVLAAELVFVAPSAARRSANLRPPPRGPPATG